MYICVCNAITEKDIEDLIDSNPEHFRAPAYILIHYNTKFKCKKCVEEFYNKIESYYEQKNSS